MPSFAFAVIARNTLDYVKAGFPVDRSLEQTKQICEEKLHLLKIENQMTIRLDRE